MQEMMQESILGWIIVVLRDVTAKSVEAGHSSSCPSEKLRGMLQWKSLPAML